MIDRVAALGCLPTYKTFKHVLIDEERRRVYMRAYRAHMEGRVRDKEKSEARLRRYIKIAGWDNESLKRMQAVAMTPVH